MKVGGSVTTLTYYRYLLWNIDEKYSLLQIIDKFSYPHIQWGPFSKERTVIQCTPIYYLYLLRNWKLFILNSHCILLFRYVSISSKKSAKHSHNEEIFLKRAQCYNLHLLSTFLWKRKMLILNWNLKKMLFRHVSASRKNFVVWNGKCLKTCECYYVIGNRFLFVIVLNDITFMNVDSLFWCV